jgi:hypothetical protein
MARGPSRPPPACGSLTLIDEKGGNGRRPNDQTASRHDLGEGGKGQLGAAVAGIVFQCNLSHPCPHTIPNRRPGRFGLKDHVLQLVCGVALLLEPIWHRGKFGTSSLAFITDDTLEPINTAFASIMCRRLLKGSKRALLSPIFSYKKFVIASQPWFKFAVPEPGIWVRFLSIAFPP